MKSGEEFDLLIIGAGATGAGAALDAASRGLKVACVEREDFASGTSSRSTKLIWAGSRYLVQAFVNLLSPSRLLKNPIKTVKSFYGEFKMVLNCHRERTFLMEKQPHLTNWVPIAVPLQNWLLFPPPYGFWPAVFGPFGVFQLFFKFYDSMARFRVPPSHKMNKNRSRRVFSQLDPNKIKYCQVFYEGQHNDARTNLSLALTASQKGAHIANYCEVVDLLKNSSGHVTGARVLDVEDLKRGNNNAVFEIKAKATLFCGGPFTDSIRRMESKNGQFKKAVDGAAGIHVVLPAYYCSERMGMVDMTTSDNRFLFFLPWLGHTIVGTTDTSMKPTMRPCPTEDEIQWVINEASKYLKDDLRVRRQDVLSAWSGIRPLASDPNAKNDDQESRDHVISVDPKTKTVFITGGKWTTYREMAEEAVDEVIKVKKLTPKWKECNTLNIELLGRNGYSTNLPAKLVQKYQCTQEVADHLARTYGGRAKDVLDLAKPTGKRWPKIGRPLVETFPYIEAEVVYGVREFARTAEDILARRTRLAFLNLEAAIECLDRVIEIMAKELQWDSERKAEEKKQTIAFLSTFGGPEPNKSDATLREATIADIYAVFKEVDTHKSGYLDKDSIERVIKRLGFSLSSDELTRIFAAMDTNDNGKIELSEFVKWWNSKKNNEFRAKLHKEFSVTSKKLENAHGIFFG